MSEKDEFILKELSIFFISNVEGRINESSSDEYNKDESIIIGYDHSKLSNLDYESSGHIGFASQKELNNYAKSEELPQSLTNLEIENIMK